MAALGAALGELLLGRRLGRRALAWGAFFGLLPGLDVILYPLLGEARELWWHRGPSHSLSILAAISYAAAVGLERLWKRDKVSRAEAWLAVFLLMAAHVLLDCLTVRGAAVLWPIQSRRVSFDLLDPNDPLFAAPLVVAAVWLALLKEVKPKKTRGKKPPPPSKRRRPLAWGLGLAGGYLAFAIAMKSIAAAGFRADLARRGLDFSRQMEAPTPYNIFLWRAVASRPNELWVGYRTVFESKSTPVRWTVFPIRPETLARVAKLPATRILTDLADGWWIARPDVRGAWLGDLHYCEARTWGARKGMVDHRLARAWVIDANAKREPLLPVTPQAGDDSLRRMFQRIFGNRENWEANPRLSGVQGSLPEPLETRD